MDLKSLLDQTLLINTFNDLQRYYKNITVYYNYDIETKEEIKNNRFPDMGYVYTNFSTSETFKPAKNEDTSITIDLKDLIFTNYTSQNSIDESSWSPADTTNEYIKNRTGTAYIYGKTTTNYNFNSYEFIINDSGNLINNWNIKYENKNLIGMSIMDNNLKWTFYLQASLGKIENLFLIQHTYARRYINNIRINIYKIVLNSR